MLLREIFYISNDNKIIFTLVIIKKNLMHHNNANRMLLFCSVTIKMFYNSLNYLIVFAIYNYKRSKKKKKECLGEHKVMIPISLYEEVNPTLIWRPSLYSLLLSWISSPPLCTKHVHRHANALTWDRKYGRIEVG